LSFKVFLYLSPPRYSELDSGFSFLVSYLVTLHYFFNKF